MKTWLALLALLMSSALVSTCAMAQQYPAPIQALTAKGFTINGEMDAPPGYHGFVAEYRGRPVPLYLMPDGKHVSLGNLFDENGNDLTRTPFEAAIGPKLDGDSWAKLQKSAWVAEGALDPQRVVYVFTDTECPYCHALWQATQKYARQGNVQIRNIIVAVIAPISAGRGAAILDAANPTLSLAQHEQNPKHSPIKPLTRMPKTTATKLASNGALMNSLGIRGTPGIVYRDASGKIKVAQGMQSPSKLKEIFGS